MTSPSVDEVFICYPSTGFASQYSIHPACPVLNPFCKGHCTGVQIWTTENLSCFQAHGEGLCRRQVDIACSCCMMLMVLFLERIVQVGKKKLVLDHLIVQKMDDEESGGENIQSILTFGAQALFDADNSSRDIICELFACYHRSSLNFLN